MLLPLLVPVEFVELPRTSPEAIDIRILNDVADEETELLDEDLYADLLDEELLDLDRPATYAMRSPKQHPVNYEGQRRIAAHSYGVAKYCTHGLARYWDTEPCYSECVKSNGSDLCRLWRLDRCDFRA